MTTTDFSAIPHGFYLTRIFHKSVGRHVLHLSLKTNDGTYYEQMNVPAYSSNLPVAVTKDFWAWAEVNLPVYEYPEHI